MDLINATALQALVDKMVSDRLAILKTNGEQVPEYMTAAAAAEYLGISRSTFWRLRKEHPISAYFFEVSYPCFKRSDLEEWAEQFKK